MMGGTSTSSSLSDATQPGSESRERQSNDSPDPLQKRFQDLLAELAKRPNVSKETLEPTFRSLELAFLDMKDCSFCLFC